MDGPRPTFLQRFFAGPGPFWIWFGGWSLALPACFFASTEVPWHDLLAWPRGPLAILVMLLSAPAGFLIAAVLYGPFLSGLFESRTRANGGPFHPGDRVSIIRGPHAGTITTVYDDWAYDSVRVDLGPQAREKYKDIFGGNELLRVRTTPPDTPPTPMSS